MSNSLKQYIELYKEHHDLIDANSAPALNEMRRMALDVLENCTLPRKGSENYEITDLNEMLAPDFGLNIARVPIDVNPSESFRCDVPNLSSALFLILNDTWAETDRARKSLPDGVIFDSLRNASIAHPELIKKYYAGISDLTNPVVALDTLLAQDGFFLYVPSGVKIEKPLQLVNILQNGMSLMAVRRGLIIIEEGAEARLLICDHTQNPETDFLALQTIEIYAGKNSTFDLYDMEESSQRTSRLSAIYLKQKEGSNVLLDGITLYNGNSRNEYYCTLDGQHSSLRLLGLAIEDKHRKADTYSIIRHEASDCKSDELFKYTIDDEAMGGFSGRIYVDQDAARTEAYQSNRNIVGSDTARMMSKPQLEIYNDDVKCSHGTAIGQLDPMQLFYMRTRGLSEDSARLLLKQAFMADIIDGVRLPVLRDRLKLLVERRLSGAESLCHECGTNCS